MHDNSKINISQCQNDLKAKGHTICQLELPEELKVAVQQRDFNLIDQLMYKLLEPAGMIFELLKIFCPVNEIEHIISLRCSDNEWEEDGIWHDDGSRMLAFSLSLTTKPPKGGVLEIRKKGYKESTKISTPDYGNIIIFKTGIDNYEHKINKVTEGQRLIIAGWCYPSKSISSL